MAVGAPLSALAGVSDVGDPAADAPFRMDKVAERLQQLIGRPVKKVADTVGPQADELIEGTRVVVTAIEGATAVVTTAASPAPPASA